MRNTKIRIGTKLGLSAFVGLALVASMVWNETRVNRLTFDLMSQVASSRDLQQAALDTRIKLTELITIDRDLRLARTLTDVNYIVQMLNTRAEEAGAAYDGAIAIARKSDDKQLLARAKDAFQNYVLTANEVAGLQNQIIALRDQQLQESMAWSKEFDTLINSRVIAMSANRHALENNLQQAHSEFMRAVSLAWSRFVRSDSTQLDSIFDALATASLLLDEARGMIRNPEERIAIEALQKYPPRYKSIIDAQTDAVTRQNDLLLERAQAQRTDASDMMGLVAIGANLQADQLAELNVKEISRASWLGLIAGALTMIVMIGVAIVSSLNIGRPIRRIADVLAQLANDRNAVDIPYRHRRDEIGDASRAASIFRDNIARMQQLEDEQKRTVAEAAEARRQQTRQLADDFERAVGAIVRTVSSATDQLQGTAKSLTQTAAVTHSLANSVSVAATEASSNVRSVAVASDQLAASIAEIGAKAQHSRQIADDAVRSAATTDARIAQMTQAADRIGHVLGLITGIAQKTNLLALNATIEAARSGEAGRGFAVVASEVKTLASQTAKATEEIAGHISDIQDVTRDSVAAIKEIGSIIERVSEIATLITSAVEEQHAATREIAYNVQEAAQGTDNVTNKIKSLEADASETGVAANQVFTAASQLAAEGNTLKAQVEQFLRTVRAA